MAQLTGRGEFFINSIKMATIAGGSVDAGGEVRETVRGQFGPLGYKVVDVAPGAVEIEIAHSADVDIRNDLDVTDATVIGIMDTGTTFLIVNATRVGDPLTLNVESGTISARYEGKVAEII